VCCQSLNKSTVRAHDVSYCCSGHCCANGGHALQRMPHIGVVLTCSTGATALTHTSGITPWLDHPVHQHTLLHTNLNFAGFALK
jgi:hypothetical protein